MKIEAEDNINHEIFSEHVKMWFENQEKNMFVN